MPLFATPDITLESAIQLGCFGLIALLVSWLLWKGLPGLLGSFERIVTVIANAFTGSIDKLTSAFQEDSAACREERKQDKERADKMWDRLQVMIDKIDAKVEGSQ